MSSDSTRARSTRTRPFRAALRRLAAYAVVALTLLPGVAAAHGSQHPQPYPQWLALVVLVGGVGVVGASVLAGQRGLERAATLGGVFLGLVVAAAGAVGLVQLSPVQTLSASQAPIDRAWYAPLTLAVGIGIAVASLVVGRLKFPERPRYAFVGALLGMWVAYPVLGGLENPVGYLLVVALPVAVAYVVYSDARGILARVGRDPLARRFGVGTGVLAALFFAFSMGMVTFVPEHGVGVPDHGFVEVTPVANPLVYWSGVEFFFPAIPASGVVSLGMAIQVGLVAALVGLNGAIIANQWQGTAPAGTTETTTGTAAVAAPNACCCCGPVVTELAVVAVGPSAAAPLYWLFVDLASPVGALFFVGSVGLLAGNLVYVGRERC
jgi:hypothetical protein